MDILGFIKNKNASRQQSVAQTSQSQQKPETAKEMYTRVAAEEQAAKKPITPAVEAKADRVRALETIYKATQHLDSARPQSAPENAGSPTAQLQNQNHQDKTQSALSPTDHASGKAPSQDRRKAPEKAPERPQTIQRPRPSWER